MTAMTKEMKTKNALDMTAEEFAAALRAAKGLPPRRWTPNDRPPPLPLSEQPLPLKNARDMTDAEYKAAVRAIKNPRFRPKD